MKKLINYGGIIVLIAWVIWAFIVPTFAQDSDLELLYRADDFEEDGGNLFASGLVGLYTGDTPKLALKVSPPAPFELTQTGTELQAILDGTMIVPLILKTGAYQTTLASSTAEGLSGVDFRIGLNETLRAMVLVDAGDITADLGIVPEIYPTFYIFDDDVSHFTAFYQKAAVLWIDNSEKGTSAQMLFQTDRNMAFNLIALFSSGNAFDFISGSAAKMTDTNGKQTWFNIQARIDQSGTAAYDGLGVNVIESGIGSGATGDGNNIVNFAIEGVSKWRLDRTGNLITIDSLIVHREKSFAADDGEIVLATGVAGWGFAMVGDMQEFSSFTFTSAGVVTLGPDASTNVTNTDTDTNLAIYDAGSGVAIKNRLGSNLTLAIEVHYYAP